MTVPLVMITFTADAVLLLIVTVLLLHVASTDHPAVLFRDVSVLQVSQVKSNQLEPRNTVTLQQLSYEKETDEPASI